jgi:hypothetical protein
MNVGTIFGDRFTGRYRLVDGLRTLDDVRGLRNIGLRWLFMHAESAATSLPEEQLC